MTTVLAPNPTLPMAELPSTELDWDSQSHLALADAIASKRAVVGVIGLGYVGLPLAVTTARAGFRTIGFDIDPGKVEKLKAGTSYIEAVKSEDLALQLGAGRLRGYS